MMRRPRRRSKSMDASLSMDSMGGSHHSQDSTCSFLTTKSHGSGLGLNRPTRKQKPQLKRAASSGFGLTSMRNMLGASRNNHHSHQEEQKKLNELNIFCSDALVSTAFCLSRMELAQKNPSIVKLELEDMIDRKDQTLFLEVMDVMIADRRPWKWIRFTDHLYTEERYDRYLGFKQQLWRLVEDQAIKRHIPVQFQAIMEIARGSTTEYVVNFLRRLNDSADLKSVEFAGAMFGFLPWRIPNELEQLCNKGYLRETIVLKLWYKNIATDAENHAVALSLDCTSTGDGGEEEVAKSGAQLGDNSVQMGKARSVQVLAACIDLLRELQVEVEGDEELQKGNSSNTTGETSRSPRFRARGNNQSSESRNNRERPGLRRCGTTGHMSRRRLAIVKLTEKQQEDELETSQRRRNSGSMDSSSGRRGPRLRRSSTMPLRRRLALVKPQPADQEAPPPPKRVSDTSISESSTGTMDASSSLEKLNSMREGFKAIRRRASMEMMGGNSPDTQQYTPQNGGDQDPEPRRKSIRRSRSIGSAFRTRLHSPPPPPELDSSCDSDKSHPKSPGLMRSVRRRQPPRRHKSFDDSLKLVRSPGGTPRRLRRPSRVRKATSEGQRRSSGSHYSDDTASLDSSQPRRHSSNGTHERILLSTSNRRRSSLINRTESMSGSEGNSRRRRSSSSRNKRESMSGSEDSIRRSMSSSRNRRDSMSRFEEYRRRHRSSSRNRRESKSESQDSSRRTSIMNEDGAGAELAVTSEDERDSDTAPALKDYSMKDRSSPCEIMRNRDASEGLADSRRRDMKVGATEDDDFRSNMDVESNLHGDEKGSGENSVPITPQAQAAWQSFADSGLSPEAAQRNDDKHDDSSPQMNDEPELCWRVDPSSDLPPKPAQRYDESNDDSSSQAYDEPDLCWHIDNISSINLPPKKPALEIEPETEPELCWHLDNEPSSNLLAKEEDAPYELGSDAPLRKSGEAPETKCKFDDNRNATIPAEEARPILNRDNSSLPTDIETEQANGSDQSPNSHLPAVSKPQNEDNPGSLENKAAQPDKHEHALLDVKAEQLREFADGQNLSLPGLPIPPKEGKEPVAKEVVRQNQDEHGTSPLMGSSGDDGQNLQLPSPSQVQKEEEIQSAQIRKAQPQENVPSAVLEPQKEDNGAPAALSLTSPPHRKKAGPSSSLSAPLLSRNHSDYLPSLLRSETEPDDDDASLILDAELDAASIHPDNSRAKPCDNVKRAQADARGHSTDVASLGSLARTGHDHKKLRTSKSQQGAGPPEIQSQQSGPLGSLVHLNTGQQDASVPLVQPKSQGQNQQREHSSSLSPGKPYPNYQSDDDSNSDGVLDEIMHNSIALMDIGMLHDMVSGTMHTENNKSIMELFGTNSKEPEYGLGSGGSIGSSSTLTMDGFCSVSSVDTSKLPSSKIGKKKEKKKKRSKARGRTQDFHKSSSSLDLSPKPGNHEKHRRDEESPSRTMAGPLAPQRFSKSMSTLRVAAADLRLSDSDDNSVEEDATAFTFDHEIGRAHV